MPGLLDLPIELRFKILSFVLPMNRAVTVRYDFMVLIHDLFESVQSGLFCVSRQIRQEAILHFFNHNHICVDTGSEPRKMLAWFQYDTPTPYDQYIVHLHLEVRSCNNISWREPYDLAPFPSATKQMETWIQRYKSLKTLMVQQFCEHDIQDIEEDTEETRQDTYLLRLFSAQKISRTAGTNYICRFGFLTGESDIKWLNQMAQGRFSHVTFV